MDYRRDVLPPFLALALSVSLHLGLTQVRLRLPDRAEDLDLTPVSVEYLPVAQEGGTPDGEEAAAAPPEAEPPAAQEPEAEAPPPPEVQTPPPEVEAEPPPPHAESAPEPETPPAAATVPTEPAPAARAEPTPAEPLPPPPEPVPETAAPAQEETAPLPATAPAAPAPRPAPSAQPALQDLLPRPEDLKPYARAATAPDPAGGEAQEVTLALGETDVRYRGYLEQVQTAIDRSWRWREALLAAGVGGQVLVRFSLSPAGQVDEVGVVESSGSPVLDREATDAVRRAPVPEFPTHWTLQRLNLFAQFAYRVE